MELLDHGGVCANIYLLIAVLVGITANNDTGFAGKVFFKCFGRLFYKFATVAEKENAFCPFCPNHELAECNGHPCLTCSSSLN